MDRFRDDVFMTDAAHAGGLSLPSSRRVWNLGAGYLDKLVLKDIASGNVGSAPFLQAQGCF